MMLGHPVRGVTGRPLTAETKSDLIDGLITVRSDLRSVMNEEPWRDFIAKNALIDLSGIRYLPEEFSHLNASKVDLAMCFPALLATLDRVCASATRGPPQPDPLTVLRDILPDQRVAPAQFTIRDGRLAIVPQPGSPDAADQANIAAARRQLLANGQRILQEINSSNCDRRFIATFEYLQNLLASEHNIVELALTNMGCDVMWKSFEQELSAALTAMLLAHTTGIGMFVGQFPDWSRFVDNAAAVELEPADTAKIATAARALAAELRAKPEIAEPDVPATLARLSELIADPVKASKRAAFAVLRTIENLVSKIFSYAVDFLDQTAKKTSDKLSSAVSKAIVVVLLTTALGSATGLTPVAERITEISWMKSAVGIVKKQIDELSSSPSTRD
jgi:hypothetical protein